MKLQKRINFRKKLRTNRTRSKILGTAERPRLSVFRSNRFIYAQLINDNEQKTFLAVSDKDLINGSASKHLNKTDRAKELGKIIAEKAKQAGIKTIVFDRGPYQYHGRVRAVAQGARENGLNF